MSSVGLEFLNASDIRLNVTNTLPPRITWTNEEDVKCLGLNISYTCQVPSINLSINVAFTEHNAFHVTCTEKGSWNGPTEHYIFNLMGHKSGKNKTCDFEFKDLSYSTDYNLSVDNDKALIGFLVVLILITSVALAMVLYKIFILQRNKCEAEVLLDVYKKKIADEGRLFLAEFQSIPRIFSRNTMKEAKKSYNATKNRYVDILPYDYNRVQLTTGNNETGCDYINASFINGYQEPKKYIAAQGPKDETVASFWRMIWEQKSSIIVMVTRCEEGNRVKCAQYWPAAVEEMEDFEEFVVKLSKEEQCPDYIVRHLTLFKKKEHLEREVTQIQFISWPDHGVPEEPQLLLKLRKRVNTFKNLFSGPIVVHCSAGVGRTGTYIGIDAMMEGLESEGQVDIYGYIVNLRRQRCLMVQVETQYILIHQAMIENNQFGETEISLSEFHRTLTLLKETGSGGEPSVLQEEFQRLPKYNNWRTCNTGADRGEQEKESLLIRRSIVFVKLEDDQSHDCDHDYENDDTSSDGEDEESMKYINASHIDGYWGPGSLITAQSPLANTTADFWLMVYQKRATAIVMLSDCTEGDTELCFPYWDQDMKAFEDIEVKVTETECTPAVTIRTMHMYHTKRKESRRVKQFHFLNWSYQKLPEDSLQLMDTIRTIKQTCGYGEGPLEGQGPLVVHCSNGSCQSGLFCALWNLMDSGNTESMADVFQVAKALRKQRPGMIKSLEQYQFLYEAVAAAFPVQNGDVIAAAGDAVHIVDETGHTEAELVVGSATDDHLVAGASTPLVERATDEEQESKTIAAEAASNGSTVTMEEGSLVVHGRTSVESGPTLPEAALAVAGLALVGSFLVAVSGSQRRNSWRSVLTASGHSIMIMWLPSSSTLRKASRRIWRESQTNRETD
ncbi:Receptor-type tyrosine-protein phosphatase C [Merluccius polli]|uniref:Receptor-type tyrosine-protein phosphatase C n=1 Tax=Merluccius polli TaxID=89951 RepID=A0AA47MYG8_MERPO|nr:Receptor-type tyrosine-protein phosphatase C [Merluccius polli]